MKNWINVNFISELKKYNIKLYLPNAEYDESKKNILMISHTLESGGAPIVLLDLSKRYQETYNVFWVAMKDGNLRDEVLSQNIPITMAMPTELNKVRSSIIENFEMVWINTLVCHGFLMLFQNADMPTFWWIHEGDKFLELYYERMPEFPLYSQNIKIFSITKRVQKWIKKYYGIDTGLLHMPVDDMYILDEHISDNDKIVFFMPAKFQRRKGQDIMVQAILGLSERYKDKAKFIFAGQKDEQEMDYYYLIEQLAVAYPGVIKMLGEISREEVYDTYKYSDCVLAPSREDPTPTTIVEGMMFEKLCICSDGTGISEYIEDGKNGFISRNEDVAHLQSILEYVIDNFDKLSALRKAGRRIYLNNFETSVVNAVLENL